MACKPLLWIFGEMLLKLENEIASFEVEVELHKICGFT